MPETRISGRLLLNGKMPQYVFHAFLYIVSDYNILVVECNLYGKNGKKVN